jgi:hypothetical protein
MRLLSQHDIDRAAEACAALTAALPRLLQRLTTGTGTSNVSPPARADDIAAAVRHARIVAQRPPTRYRAAKSGTCPECGRRIVRGRSPVVHLRGIGHWNVEPKAVAYRGNVPRGDLWGHWYLHGHKVEHHDLDASRTLHRRCGEKLRKT